MYKMEVDTGTFASCISQEKYMEQFSKHELMNSNMTLKGYTGKQFKPLGYFKCDVNFNGNCNNVCFYVIKDGGPTL